MRRDRNTARKRFYDYEAERLASRRKDRDVAERKPIYKLLTALIADETVSLSVCVLKTFSLGAVSDDKLRSRQIELEEFFRIFFRRETAEKNEDGFRKRRKGRGRISFEECRIYTERPQGNVPKTVRLQLLF